MERGGAGVRETLTVRRHLLFYDESVRKRASILALSRKGDMVELAIADHIQLGKVGRLQKPAPEHTDDAPPPQTIDTRQLPSPGQAASWAIAASVGKYVPLEVLNERLETCRSCEYVRGDDKGMWCGLCGCALQADKHRVRNLAAYEEKLDPESTLKVAGVRMGNGRTWGCKHPRRQQGFGWKR